MVADLVAITTKIQSRRQSKNLGIKHLMEAIICHRMCVQIGIVVLTNRDLIVLYMHFHFGVFLSRTVRHLHTWLQYMR